MNTAVNPFCSMGATVVGKPAATVITSSPGRSLLSLGSLGLVKADIATRLALDPEFTKSDFRTPRNSASWFSNLSPSGPSVSQKSSVLDTAASTSSSVKTLPAYGTTVSPGMNFG